VSSQRTAALPAIDDDTIVALATAPGRGALATLRVSGGRAHELCRRVLEPWPEEFRRATLAVIRDPQDGKVVDQVIAVVYQAPASYTGEAMVEVTGHGGALSPIAIISLLTQIGARQARPGEFTQRAVLNGKLDLVQAESIADVIDAHTEASRRAALFQLDGGLSARIAALRSQVLDLEGLLAYEIDFPEEDDGPIPRDRVDQTARKLFEALDALLATAGFGEVIRSGAIVVIAGRPNVGKSSLFNALLGYRRAIVTDIPGTTRDALEAMIESARWPLRLIDTAGLRTTTDIIERQGVEISQTYLNAAHVALVCGDEQEGLQASVATVRELSKAPVIAVHTKVDSLKQAVDLPAPSIRDAEAVIQTSSVTGRGLAELIEAIQRILDVQVGMVQDDTPVLTRARHQAAIRRARDEVALFMHAWRQRELPPSIIAVHIRAAASALEELIGAVDVEDVLERVFATFCIGK
jgi:tRNA modification GTPase